MSIHRFARTEAGTEGARGSIHALVFLAIAMILLAPLPVSWAQDSSKTTDADFRSDQANLADFYESFSHHDAHATAMTFAEDADFTNMRGVHRHAARISKLGLQISLSRQS